MEEKIRSGGEDSFVNENVDQNLDDSFVDNSIEDADEFESNMDSQFFRLKRLSCFAHNLMLAVKDVSYELVAYIMIFRKQFT